LIETGPLLFFLIGFFIGALEEIGWRGYAQEALQRRISVVWASLVIGIFWALWHLPLFFLPGSYQAGLGVGTPAFWGFNLAIVVGSPLYAWFYNVSGRSVFAPLLFHGLGNVAGEIFVDAAPLTVIIVNILLVLIVVLISRGWMTKTLYPD